MYVYFTGLFSHSFYCLHGIIEIPLVLIKRYIAYIKTFTVIPRNILFRSFHPYSFPGNKDTHGINTARTVEVIREAAKKFFY